MNAVSEDLLQTATERLVAEFAPERIWLFGSRAWGTPPEGSDFDLMVIVSKSEERPIRRAQRAQRCLGDLEMSKDVFVQTREEFDHYLPLRASIQHKIVASCRKLYG